MFTIASEETFQEGQIIFKEGSSGDWVYVIQSGAVEISKTVNGKKFVIAILREGEVFGELGFIGGINRTATAQAASETKLGVLDREALDVEFNKLSSDLRAILVASVRRFEKMLERACDFSERADTRHQKTLTLNYKDRESFVKSYTSNISGGGLFVKTEKPLNQDDKFLLKLQLPGLPEPLKINCEVAWARTKTKDPKTSPPGMGIKFLDMNRKDNEALKAYIEEITK